MAQTRLRRLAEDGTLATFVTVDLELGYSARDPREHQGIARVRGQLVQLAFVEGIASRAPGPSSARSSGGTLRAWCCTTTLTSITSLRSQGNRWTGALRAEPWRSCWPQAAADRTRGGHDARPTLKPTAPGMLWVRSLPRQLVSSAVPPGRAGWCRRVPRRRRGLPTCAAPSQRSPGVPGCG
jgi:hypothetical protein